jgi:hypothetical protein
MRNLCHPNPTLLCLSCNAVFFAAVAAAGYVLPSTPGAAAVECPASTYSPQLNRLKTCLPCQSGLMESPDFKANGGVRKSKDEVCSECCWGAASSLAASLVIAELSIE